MRKTTLLFPLIVILGIALAVEAQEKSQTGMTSENIVAQIDTSSWIQSSLLVSPDSKRVIYAAIVSNKQFVVVDGKEGKQYDGIGKGYLMFSPDSKRVAYGAIAGNKPFVVVDGKEEKQYDEIAKGSLIFSPDSKRVAYGAIVGDKQFVVIDGQEKKQYDGIMIIGDGRIVFDSSDRLHYLATNGNRIYLVDETIK
jgi:hypothetical protein